MDLLSTVGSVAVLSDRTMAENSRNNLVIMIVQSCSGASGSKSSLL